MFFYISNISLQSFTCLSLCAHSIRAMMTSYATRTLLLASSVLGSPLLAASRASHVDSLQERQAGSADGIIALVELIEGLIANNHNAWVRVRHMLARQMHLLTNLPLQDTDIPNSCVITFSTENGGNCIAEVACGDDIGAGKFSAVAQVPGPAGSTDEWSVSSLLASHKPFRFLTNTKFRRATSMAYKASPILSSATFQSPLPKPAASMATPKTVYTLPYCPLHRSTNPSTPKPK